MCCKANFANIVSLGGNSEKSARFIRSAQTRLRLVENVLPWIPVHNDERQQEQGSGAKHTLLNAAQFLR